MTSTFAPTSSASAVKSVDPSTDFILKKLFNITKKSSKKYTIKTTQGTSTRKLMRTLYPVDKMTREKMWRKKQKNKMEVRQKFKGRDLQESKTTLVNEVKLNAGPAQDKPNEE